MARARSCSRAARRRRSWASEPLARVVASATYALDPQVMGIAPAFAIPKALLRAGSHAGGDRRLGGPRGVRRGRGRDSARAAEPARRVPGPGREAEPERRRGRDRPSVRLLRHPLRADARHRAARAQRALRRARRVRRLRPGRRARAREPGCLTGARGQSHSARWSVEVKLPVARHSSGRPGYG